MFLLCLRNTETSEIFTFLRRGAPGGPEVSALSGIKHFMVRYNTGTGTSWKENFQTVFMVAGGGFLSYWNHQLINFEERRDNGEINTFENFPCLSFFLGRHPCAYNTHFLFLGSVRYNVVPIFIFYYAPIRQYQNVTIL